jgi:general stress protein 26
MINLKEERDSLKAQLQHERANILLVKSQYEDTLKHQREMLNETGNELKNLVTSTNSETAFVSNRLGEKTQEIQQLTSGVSFSSFIPLMFEVPMRRATGFGG